MQALKQILQDSITITDAEWLLFKNELKVEKFKAKETIVRAGKIATNIYFIESGLMRSYYLQDGKEISTYFACDNQFISTFSSFITQTPSFEYLEAIEDTVVYALQSSVMTDLYNQSSKFEKLGRILAEKNYLCILDRTMVMQTKTAKEKYIDFLNSYNRKIVMNVPQHQIASFLGIAPESLSRVRKEIVNS